MASKLLLILRCMIVLAFTHVGFAQVPQRPPTLDWVLKGKARERRVIDSSNQIVEALMKVQYESAEQYSNNRVTLVVLTDATESKKQAYHVEVYSYDSLYDRAAFLTLEIPKQEIWGGLSYWEGKIKLAKSVQIKVEIMRKAVQLVTMYGFESFELSEAAKLPIRGVVIHDTPTYVALHEDRRVLDLRLSYGTPRDAELINSLAEIAVGFRQ